MIKNKSFFVFAVLAIIIASFSVSAATLTNTVINLTGSNTTINVTNTWTYDKLTVDDTSMSVYNLSQSGAVTSDVISLNFSEANKRYVGTDIPYFTGTTASTRTLTSNVQTLTNVEVIMNVPQCNAKRVTYTTSNNSVNQTFTGNCNGDTATRTVSKVELGGNTFTFSDYVGGTSGVLLSSGVAVLLAVALLITLAFPFFNNNWEDMDTKEWITYFVVSLIWVFLIIILLNYIFSIT